jgi:Uma2 family endonuclease
MVVTPNVNLPTHLDLPDTDGLPVDNDFQAAQARLLTSALEPVLKKLHEEGDYFIGQDVGIYWKATRPPLNGCKSPDWYYVPGCPPTQAGEFRRSFVLWDEGVAPLIVMEFVSGDGTEEHDDTRGTGKFWVYRRGIRAYYYAIHDPVRETLELYQLDGSQYRRLAADDRGLYPIPHLNVALGHWHGRYGVHELTWVRFFNLDGTLLPSDHERIEAEKARADKAAADMAELLAKLQAKGIDPNTL